MMFDFKRMQTLSDHQSFQRFAAVTAIVSFLLLAVGGIALRPLSTDFGPEVFTDPVLMLSVGADGANLLRWGMILDMFGYYLLLLPVALFLWRWFEASNPNWIRFYTFCGLGYILIAVHRTTLQGGASNKLGCKPTFKKTLVSP